MPNAPHRRVGFAKELVPKIAQTEAHPVREVIIIASVGACGNTVDAVRLDIADANQHPGLPWDEYGPTTLIKD